MTLSYFCSWAGFSLIWSKTHEDRFPRDEAQLSHVTRKPVFGSLRPRYDPNRSSQLQLYVLYFLNSEQQRCWSDCADAQADLPLCCSRMAKTGFLVTRLNYLGQYVHSYAFRVIQWRQKFDLAKHDKPISYKYQTFSGIGNESIILSLNWWGPGSWDPQYPVSLKIFGKVSLKSYSILNKYP